MSDDELLGLIFEPGFSTRDHVTDISGRGIGMDVVRRQIGAIGGTVELESSPGEGTTFTLVLPISSSVGSVLTFLVDGQRYALPSKDVERVELTLPKGPDEVVDRPLSDLEDPGNLDLRPDGATQVIGCCHQALDSRLYDGLARRDVQRLTETHVEGEIATNRSIRDSRARRYPILSEVAEERIDVTGCPVGQRCFCHLDTGLG